MEADENACPVDVPGRQVVQTPILAGHVGDSTVEREPDLVGTEERVERGHERAAVARVCGRVLGEVRRRARGASSGRPPSAGCRRYLPEGIASVCRRGADSRASTSSRTSVEQVDQPCVPRGPCSALGQTPREHGAPRVRGRCSTASASQSVGSSPDARLRLVPARERRQVPASGGPDARKRAVEEPSEERAPPSARCARESGTFIGSSRQSLTTCDADEAAAARASALQGPWFICRLAERA